MSRSAYSLCIHGGAGVSRTLPASRQPLYHEALREVVQHGEALLQAGRSAVDVVEACVRRLEEIELFNAGRGACLTADGIPEHDASIMDGRTLEAGAVAAISTIEYPVSLARLVMERSRHVLLVGEGARRFAETHGVPMVPPETFITPLRKKQWEAARARSEVVLDHQLNSTDAPTRPKDTVGAVARDIHGNLAAATSTGGMANKLPGRVGDSPLPGCGVWADNRTCAVSCTGVGEDFIRTALAKTTADFMELLGLNTVTAAKRAIAYLGERVNGSGGLIVVGADGAIAAEFNTDGMFHASVAEGREPLTQIFRDMVG